MEKARSPFFPPTLPRSTLGGRRLEWWHRSSIARRSRKSSIAQSIDRGLGAGFALVSVQPKSLDVAAHHVNPAVGRIAIARAKLVERGDIPVALLVLALALCENLLAGSLFQVVDVRLVDIELQN